MLKVAFFAVVLLATVQVSIADEDIWEEVKQIEVFKLKKSALGCPAIVIGQSCPDENPLYYFKCCGDLNSSCCFRLQDWAMVLLVVMVGYVVKANSGTYCFQLQSDRDFHLRQSASLHLLLLNSAFDFN
ncbi:hypothetical protein M3Y98_00447400 [Aphelenchoides besseyi]|nr:hypothetical protein M3Y98_00447400 [Aphelenchoides besseyi]KAI6207354.1 hypothetical protein M3Y96_00000400 [Aphelenchoides besseyi]